jgi:hypothetical protein
MVYEIIVEDEFGTVRGNFTYNNLPEAKRVAKDGARHEQGRAVVSEDNAVVIEYKYEDGTVNSYDDEGNQIGGFEV